MSEPKIPLNMINVKVFLHIRNMYNLKNRKMAKLSLDARRPKPLISHLSTQVNLIQYFHSFFPFI